MTKINEGKLREKRIHDGFLTQDRDATTITNTSGVSVHRQVVVVGSPDTLKGWASVTQDLVDSSAPGLAIRIIGFEELTSIFQQMDDRLNRIESHMELMTEMSFK